MASRIGSKPWLGYGVCGSGKGLNVEQDVTDTAARTNDFIERIAQGDSGR